MVTMFLKLTTPLHIDQLDQVLDVLVVRPALVYGYGGGLLKPFLDPVIQAIKTKSASAQVNRTCYEMILF